MIKYRVFQRDDITGHMNAIADLECHDDREATRLGRKYAGKEPIILCQGRRIIHMPSKTERMASPTE